MSENGSPSGFDAFWDAYPKKVGKRAAALKWRQLRPPLEQCLRALALQKRSPEWRKDGGAFIPYPATWLHQGRWDDEPAAAASPRALALKHKLNPAGWDAWRDKNYPHAEKIPFYRAPDDIKNEFLQSH